MNITWTVLLKTSFDSLSKTFLKVVYSFPQAQTIFPAWIVLTISLLSGFLVSVLLAKFVCFFTIQAGSPIKII